jgi:hypothetical protein
VVPGARGNGIASKLLDNILGHFPGQEMRLKPQPFEDERWPGEDGLDEDQRRSFYRSRGFEDDRPREDGDWEGWERMMRHAVGKGISHEQLSDAIEDYGEAGLPPSCYEPSRAGGWCRDVSHEFAARLGALGHHDHSVRDVHRGGGEIHTVNRVNVEGTPHVVDWTGRQYDPDVDVPARRALVHLGTAPLPLRQQEHLEKPGEGVVPRLRAQAGLPRPCPRARAHAEGNCARPQGRAWPSSLGGPRSRDRRLMSDLGRPIRSRPVAQGSRIMSSRIMPVTGNARIIRFVRWRRHTCPVSSKVIQSY